jgi:hypothetical protein
MSMMFFYIGFGCLAVALVIVSVMVRRLEQRVEVMSQFLEIFSKATIHHVTELREVSNLSSIKEDVSA